MTQTQTVSPLSVPGKRVAVIGAGISGLATAACLLEEGIEPALFEQAAQPGGIWNAPEADSVLYPSLRTNTSKHTFAFSGFPFPPTTPDYPSWSHVRDYLKQYIAHAGLSPYIQCNALVEAVEPTDSWQWRLRVRAGSTTKTDIFAGVVICSGRDQVPALPHFPGADRFGSPILHSSTYQGPEAFVGQHVVVVGAGSSGVDLATEVSQVARRVYLAMTPRTWFIPRYILNRPYDHLLSRLSTRLPFWMRQSLFHGLVLWEYRRSGISLELLRSHGVMLPPFDLWRTRFTPCSDLLQQMKRGAIEGKPAVTQLEPHQVRFSDGSQVEADALLCCTGYQVQFPFLSPTLLEITRGRMDLYRHIFPPHLPNLAVVGLVTVAGSHPPVAEMQGRWVARVFAGASKLPSVAEMQADIEKQRAHPLSQNPVPMQVQVPQYTDAIARILGVAPRVWRHPRQAYRVFMGPFSADDYRLDGPSPHGAMQGGR